MLVKCIDSKNSAGHLERNRIYEVFEKHKESYILKESPGVRWLKNRFVPVLSGKEVEIMFSRVDYPDNFLDSIPRDILRKIASKHHIRRGRDKNDLIDNILKASRGVKITISLIK